MRTSITAFFLALFGAAFCVTAALGGAEALCVTEGCSLTHSVSLFGVSLWWFGSLGFAGLAVLLATRQIKLALYLAGTAVAADCVLLGWLALTLPCVNCMIAGALFALILFFQLRVQDPAFPQRKTGWCLLAVWLLLFSPCAFSTTSELLAQPWPILGPADAPVRLFFSPTCPACRETVQAALDGDVSFVAFIPIAEHEGDEALVQELRNRLLASKKPEESLRRFFTNIRTIKPRRPPRLDLRFRLYRNKMALYRYGANKVPVTMVVGAAQRDTPDGPSQKTTGPDAPLSLSGVNGFRGCSDKPGEECD